MARAISLNHVTKRFGHGRHTVVDRFTLDNEPGEFVVIVGPSGCGKSTVLRAIAGLEDVAEGELLLDGAPADRQRARDGEQHHRMPVVQALGPVPSVTSARLPRTDWPARR
ncbi:ATP-binding cassette domain-containing protein [Streptomyces sp. NPDC020412]|uniref:ATP-binding cassette domain-containing protein n=1 Tax=Streptomyces sp. NPDC020412 TaxID=3365073 RepID=UPI0037B015E8